MASCDAFDLARYPTSFSLRRGDLIQPLRDWVDARSRRERPRARRMLMAQRPN